MEWTCTTNGHSKTDAREHEMCGGRGMVTVVQATSNVRVQRVAGEMDRSSTASSVAPLEGVVVRPIPLQQFTELLNGQARVASDTAHGESIDRIVARDGDNSLTVAHDDVLALTHDAKSGLLECAHGVEVIDTGDAGQDQPVTSISRISSP